MSGCPGVLIIIQHGGSAPACVFSGQALVRPTTGVVSIICSLFAHVLAEGGEGCVMALLLWQSKEAICGSINRLWGATRGMGWWCAERCSAVPNAGGRFHHWFWIPFCTCVPLRCIYLRLISGGPQPYSNRWRSYYYYYIMPGAYQQQTAWGVLVAGRGLLHGVCTIHAAVNYAPSWTATGPAAAVQPAAVRSLVPRWTP